MIRRLLLVPAALGVGALLVPAAAGAWQQSDPPASESVNEVALTEPAEAAAPGFEETVAVTDETQLVGIKWNGSGDPEFTLEVQEDDGSWTSPYPAEPMDVAPDEGTPEARQVAARRGSDHITEPISVVDAERVRVHMGEGVATDVEFVTVGGDRAEPVSEETPTTSPPTSVPPDTGPTDTGPPDTGPPDPAPPPEPPPGTQPAQASVLTWAGLALLALSAAGWTLVTGRHDRRVRRRGALGAIVVIAALVATGCYGGGGGGGRTTTPTPWPGIHTRAAWGAPDTPPCAGYTGNVRFAVVHHTGGGPQDNNYTDPAAKIRGIWQYHLATGYCDIAYNFLVDKYGNLWEGRAGGQYSSVMGAHTLGFNSNSTGVAILGDFTNQNASGAAQNALVNLLAWKLTLHHVDPLQPVFENGQWIHAVSAHRELSASACPGNAFYPELPRLREAIAARSFYGSPVGNIELLSRAPGGVRVAGWALDPDTSSSIDVHVYVGNLAMGIVADRPRPDIAAAYPGWGDKHGYDATLGAPPQPTKVCVYLINLGYGSNTGYCATV